MAVLMARDGGGWRIKGSTLCNCSILSPPSFTSGWLYWPAAGCQKLWYHSHHTLAFTQKIVQTRTPIHIYQPPASNSIISRVFFSGLKLAKAKQAEQFWLNVHSIPISPFSVLSILRPTGGISPQFRCAVGVGTNTANKPSFVKARFTAERDLFIPLHTWYKTKHNI